MCSGRGGMCGRGLCVMGECMVVVGGAWQGGMHGRGVCMVGACVLAGGMRAGVVSMHGGRGWHAWWPWGGACMGYDEIRSMSGRYASYWNAFLF